MANLILYYSRKGENYVNGAIRSIDVGHTARCAAYIQKAVGGDLFEIETVEPYPADYMECTRVAQEELRRGARPALKAMLTDLSAYDTVFVCGPCWWGTFPCAVFTQLQALDFAGKKVVPLMTHEGSGLGHCERDLREACRNARFGKGLAVHGAEAQNSEQAVARWAKEQTA